MFYNLLVFRAEEILKIKRLKASSFTSFETVHAHLSMRKEAGCIILLMNIIKIHMLSSEVCGSPLLVNV